MTHKIAKRWATAGMLFSLLIAISDISYGIVTYPKASLLFIIIAVMNFILIFAWYKIRNIAVKAIKGQ